MFLTALGAAWATIGQDQSSDGVSTPRPELAQWLRRVSNANAADAADHVSSTTPDLATSAARWLVTQARSLLAEKDVDWNEVQRLGTVLLRVVERGHGTSFPEGSLCKAHARMLIGMGSQLCSPTSAARQYEQAARDYDSHGQPRVAALARLAAATTEWSLLLGGDQAAVRGRLAAVDAATAGELEPALDGYLRTLQRIGVLRTTAELEMTDWQDAEAVALLELVALSSLDDVGVAARLARAADTARAAAGSAPTALTLLGSALIRQRRWPHAAAILEECHKKDPRDRDVVLRLARAYAETDRWEDTKAVLIPMLANPPGSQDVDILQLLQNEAHRRGDPGYGRWSDLLSQLDPRRTVAGQVPSTPTTPGPQCPEPIRAVLRDGILVIDADLLELPEDECTVHLTAAVVTGSPNGTELLSDLVDSNPQLAGRVMQLLRVRQISEEEARVLEHMQAGEEHFQHRRFEDAAREYQAAVEIDPDYSQGWLYIGDTWYHRGCYSLAQAYFEESIAVEPSPQAYRFLGDAIALSGGSRRRVRRCYGEALRLEPSYGGARVALQQLADSDADRDDSPEPSSQTGALRWQTPAALAFERIQEVLRGAHPTADEDTAARDDEAPSIATRQPKSSIGGRCARVGDRILDAAIRNLGAESVLPVLDDDEAFQKWIESATPWKIAVNITFVQAIAFQYETKDRDLERWAHLTRRRVALAEALPADFGPERAPGGLGRDRLLGDAYGEHGSVLCAQGRLAEARAWYVRALDLLAAEQAARARAGLTGEAKFDRICSTVDPTAVLLHNLASTCHELGDNESAARYRERAWQLDAERPTSESWIDQCVGWGDAALLQGRTDIALGAFHDALEHAEDSAHTQLTPRALTQALNALGRSHRGLGLYRSALAYLDCARQLNETTRNSVRLSKDFLELGRLFRLRPDLGDTEEAFEQSLLNTSVPAVTTDDLSWTSRNTDSYRITAADRAWESLLELGDILEKRHDLARAASFLELATRLGDVVRASVADDAERVAVANQRIEATAALTRIHLRRALAKGPDALQAADDAWLASETMRARSFLDALGDDLLTVPDGVSRVLVEREAAAIEERRRLLESGRIGVTFWDDLRRQQARLEAIWEDMLAEAPTAAEYVEVRRSRPATARDVQAWLATDGRSTVFASLNPGGADELAVIAVRSDEPRTRVASRPANLARLTRFLAENLGSAGRVRELVTDLEDLWHYETQVIGEVLAEVTNPDDVLVVCPFGALNYVPFAALTVSGVPLVERNPLAVLPNGSLVRALRTAAGTPARVQAQVFGDPTEDLVGARAEADLVGRLLGAEPLVGQQVSQAAVTAALVSARIVHIAAHARFEVDDPLSSGLRLADGQLTARTLMTTYAPALSLVTLSACETGVSETNAAQELLGLMRALMFAGADSLLVSLWKVPDASTVDIMSTFYGCLHNGTWKVDALRAATLAAREWYGAHRFDQWAGFQLMGEWR